MTKWRDIISLFTPDDGSLPDIYVDNIPPKKVLDLYLKIVGMSTFSEQIHVWCNQTKKAISCTHMVAAKGLLDGNFDHFRHSLDNLTINEITVPRLFIDLWDDSISFDFRKGNEWGQDEISALMEFLSRILDAVPAANIYQSEEGCWKTPNDEFQIALKSYYKNTRVN